MVSNLRSNIDTLEEFPVLTGMADDIDAFADETGYEGTFVDREFLFPTITNPNHEQYDAFDPYEEDECIVTGTMPNKNIYGYSEQTEETDLFPNSPPKHEEHQKEDASKERGKKRNTFMPYADESAEPDEKMQNDTQNVDDTEFMGYEQMPPMKESNSKDMEQTAEDTETFVEYNTQDNTQTGQAGNNVEEQKEPRDSIRNIEENRKDMQTPAEPVFEKVNKSDLPMTMRFDSILSQELKNVSLDESHFMLPIPDHNDPTGVKIKVYLFGTKECVPVHVSYRHKNVELIKHLITVTKREEKDPAAYELRLIDDTEDYYVPFYDISAQAPNDEIGQFDSLALCENPNYQPPRSSTAVDMDDLRKTKSSNHSTFVIFIKLPFLETRIEMEMNTKICTLSDLLRKINKRFDVDLRESMY